MMDEYINREAVMQKFAGHVKRSNNSDFVPVPTWNQAVQIVEDFPAADVRPMVKAKWVYTAMSRLVCSNCGNPVAFALKDDGWHHGDFCPNCGAKMEAQDAES